MFRKELFDFTGGIQGPLWTQSKFDVHYHISHECLFISSINIKIHYLHVDLVPSLGHIN